MRELPFVCLLLFILLTTFNYGFFSFAAFGCLLILVCITYLLFLTPRKSADINATQFLVLFCILVYSLFLFFNEGIYQTVIFPSILIKLLPPLLLPVIVSYLLPYATLPMRSKKLRLVVLVMFALILRVCIITASPTPRIDVYTMLKEAPRKLLHGENPYTATYSKVYASIIPNYFTYWPAAFLLEVPFVSTFGDPRVLLAGADLLCALLIYLTGTRSERAELLILIYLFRPNALFLLEQSWLAPLELLFILLPMYIYALPKKRWYSIMYIAVGLAILTAIKPLYLALVPFYWLSLPRKKFFTISYLVCTGLLVLPFYLWSPNDFIGDTIGFFTRAPSAMLMPVHQSLNLNTLYYVIFHRDIQHILLNGITGFVLIGLYIRSVLYKSVMIILENSILFLLIFFLCNYFSFINYYYSLTGVFLYWMSDQLAKTV